MGGNHHRYRWGTNKTLVLLNSPMRTACLKGSIRTCTRQEEVDDHQDHVHGHSGRMQVSHSFLGTLALLLSVVTVFVDFPVTRCPSSWPAHNIINLTRHPCPYNHGLNGHDTAQEGATCAAAIDKTNALQQ